MPTERITDAISDVLNAVKFGYLAAIAWIENHTHATLWLGAASLIALLLA